MPQHPVRCPLLIADLRHQSRLHPLHTAAHQGRHLVERHGGPPQRVQGRQEAFGVLLVPAGAHPAGIVQPAVLSVPHHQGAQPVAATAQRRETADHHLLAGLALDLQPSGAAAGAVGLVRALGDQPLGPEPAGMLQEVMPAAREVVTVANELGALQQRREPLLALDQRSLRAGRRRPGTGGRTRSRQCRRRHSPAPCAAERSCSPRVRSSTTASPSIKAAWTGRPAACAAIAPNRAVQSCDPRVRTTQRPCSMRSWQR